MESLDGGDNSDCKMKSMPNHLEDLLKRNHAEKCFLTEANQENKLSYQNMSSSMDGSLITSIEDSLGIKKLNRDQSIIESNEDIKDQNDCHRLVESFVKIQKPYLLFLGDVRDMLAAKTAFGLKQWRPADCVGQLRLSGCQVDCQLPDMSLAEAGAAGVKTLVVGVANRGGLIAESWVPVFLEALEYGMDLAAGLHNRLADMTALCTRAIQLGRQLIDVRHPTQTFSVGTGRKRSGKRLLTVGTDCSSGKMSTALAIERELLRRGMSATFRATGQTGILISGAGISIDAVVSDFTAGAMETLAPDNQPDHWDVIEGQGSLFHPSFASVTVGITHGAQPDALVLCHEPTRTTMRGVDYQLPDFQACMDLNLTMARLTNPQSRFVGVSLNTSGLSESEAYRQMADLEDKLRLPVVDPMRQGVARIVDKLDLP